MSSQPPDPQPRGSRVFHVLQRDALTIRRAPTGDVGTLICGEGLEAVWVAKQGEVIDPVWFSQRTVDLILVLQGELRVELASEDQWNEKPR